ncbi:Clavaminate synthase-like protein [Penicillium herquei]|nr:Clavaminate synthase-like protein [Penicillium herquei]
MADICASYTPSDRDAQRFWDQELVRQKGSLEVPDGFPKQIKSSLAWTAAEIGNKQSDWRLSLKEEEIAVIDAAVVEFEGSNPRIYSSNPVLNSRFKAKYEDLSALSTSTFRLPSWLSQRLRSLSDNLYDGAGFQIIHGLDPSRYTAKQKIIAYAGISAHICPQRGFVDVKAKGVIAHIVNVHAGDGKSKTTAPAYSNIPLSFHTDNCEIMAFFYLDMALKGGETRLSSIWQTYNELAANRPDVLHTLTEPLVMDTFKPLDLQPPRHVRLLQRTNCDKVPVLFRFSRYPITGWQRSRNPNIPQPNKALREAADAIQFIAMKNSIKLPVEKGDLLLVNDMALFHAREGFDDGDIPLKRHLIKMYFRDPNQGWNIPPSIENEWKMVYSPNQPDGTREETWHVLYESGIEELSMLNG